MTIKWALKNDEIEKEKEETSIKHHIILQK